MTELLDHLRVVTTAIQCGDRSAVEVYLQQAGDPNACYGMTLLAQAVGSGFYDIAKMLLDAGASPNGGGKSGKFPLYLAARNQRPVDVEFLQLLIEHQADVNLKYVNGNTALLESVWMNDTQKVNLLLAAGADLLTANNGGDTCLHISALKGNAAMTRLLIKAGAPVGRVKHRGRGPAPTRGIQPLHLTSFGPYGGLADVARLLLESGADVDAAESNGRTTLHHAAIRNAYRVVDVLLEFNCDVDPISLENDEHKTPLMKAVEAGHTSIVSKLLSAGAGLDTTNVWGSTPLVVAAYCGFPDVVRMLIQHGCDVDRSTSSDASLTPMRVSLRHPPHVTLALVVAGASVTGDVREFFSSQLAMPRSEHTPIFEYMLETTGRPRSLRVQCRSVIRRILGQFRCRTRAGSVQSGRGDVREEAVVDKLEALCRSGVPRRVCDIIACRELDGVLDDFPASQ